jgi:peroxiredoxin
MRYGALLLLLLTLVVASSAQVDLEGPRNEKAQKSYRRGLDYLQHNLIYPALDSFRKADKQDDGHCLGCQKKMLKYGVELQDWKTAETAGQEMVAQAKEPRSLAVAHYNLGMVFMNEAFIKRKDELFSRTHDEMSKAVAAAANFPDAIFIDGQALAHLKQDDAAKACFEQFVKMRPPDDPNRQRALRYIEEPELARARMAPPFSVTTMDGQRVSLDELKGKVVLIDFWATWCAPCREALPRIRDMVKKFQGQPLVVLSVSLDDDEQEWKDFMAKNGMTWPQYRDGGFKGPIAMLFGVQAIPQTFTIDADGILQDQHIGDASIEGKLKKLVARAREVQVTDAAKR